MGGDLFKSSVVKSHSSTSNNAVPYAEYHSDDLAFTICCVWSTITFFICLETSFGKNARVEKNHISFSGAQDLAFDASKTGLDNSITSVILLLLFFLLLLVFVLVLVLEPRFLGAFLGQSPIARLITNVFAL